MYKILAIRYIILYIAFSFLLLTKYIFMEKQKQEGALLLSDPKLSKEISASFVRLAERVKMANVKTACRMNLEEEILKLPVCARAPMLALYFLRICEVSSVYDKKKAATFELLFKLYQIAVRIYERHVLYGSYNGSIGIERFASEKNQALISALCELIASPFKNSNVYNSRLAKEICFELQLKLQGAFVSLQLRDFCVVQIMQILAMYAQDVSRMSGFCNEANRGRTSTIAEEQLYKLKWERFSLPNLQYLFFEDLPTKEEYTEFFGEFSLR